MRSLLFAVSALAFAAPLTAYGQAAAPLPIWYYAFEATPGPTYITYRADVLHGEHIVSTGPLGFGGPGLTTVAYDRIDVIGPASQLIASITPLSCTGSSESRMSCLWFSPTTAFAGGVVVTAARFVGTRTLPGGEVVPFDITDAVARLQVVPEPGTWALLGTGVIALGAVARRRRSA
jgi:hypothetical protein